MKVERRNRTVSSTGLLLNLGVVPENDNTSPMHKQLGTRAFSYDEAIVNGSLRSPSATRLSGLFGPQTQRFCVPASRQVCLYRSNQLERTFPSARRGGLYYTGLTIVCQDLTFPVT